MKKPKKRWVLWVLAGLLLATTPAGAQLPTHTRTARGRPKGEG